MAPRELIDNFMTSPPGWEKMDQNWVGVKKLGAGGFGHAGLWVQVDPRTQLITDRLVIKECYMSGGWNEKDFWHDGRVHEMPKEAYNHRAMNYKPTNVVGFYGFTVMKETKSYRVYMEFCSGGSLSGITKAYRTSEDFIPEAYLWKLFEDLARAAVTMENPDVASNEDRVLIHMDLKPDNVFMQPPDAKDASRYPTAKVADFGLSLIVSPEDSVAKIAHPYVMYTSGYIPPEVYFIRKPQNDLANVESKVDASPNIYLIGIIMLELMTKSHPEPERASGFRSRLKWLEEIQGGIYKKLPYSKALKSIVRDCLKTKPGFRPKGHELLDRILVQKTTRGRFNKDKDALLLNSINLVDKYSKGIKLQPSSPEIFPDKDGEDDEEDENVPLPVFPQTSGSAISGGSNDFDLNTESFDEISSNDLNIEDEYNLISPEEANKFTYKPELDPRVTERGDAMRQAMEDTMGGMEDVLGSGGVQELREGVRAMKTRSRPNSSGGRVKRAGGVGLGTKGLGGYFDVKKFFHK